MRSIILASASPRRREILDTIGIAYKVVVSDYDESETPEGLEAKEKAGLNSIRKGEHAAAVCGAEDVIISCDTVVELDGRILEKPADERDAASMLRSLSGRTHRVWTGLCVIDNRDGSRYTFVDHADVTFAEMTDGEIAWYISTGEPMDKAGSYGIQGYGARFITGISGNYHTVMGLPSHVLYRYMRDAGII